MLCIDGVWRSIQFSTIGASIEVRNFGCVWESGDFVDCSFVLGCLKSVVLGWSGVLCFDGVGRSIEICAVVAVLVSEFHAALSCIRFPGFRVLQACDLFL